MKVYFTASIVGKKQYLGNYLNIIEVLKKRGYKVIGDHILRASESKIRSQSKDERILFHKQLERWIGSCDFMVVESSFPSISVGYEISMALHFRKPILILYSEGDPPSLLYEHSDDRIMCEKYTHNGLPDIINDFVMYFQSAADSRFTFYITPQIARYLEQVSVKEKIPKSVYLRKLIERDMALLD